MAVPSIDSVMGSGGIGMLYDGGGDTEILQLRALSKTTKRFLYSVDRAWTETLSVIAAKTTRSQSNGFGSNASSDNGSAGAISVCSGRAV